MTTYEEHKKKHLNCKGEWNCTIWGIEQGYEKGIQNTDARWKKKIEKLKEVSFDNKGKPDDYIKGYSDAFWNFDKLIDELLGDAE